MANQIRQPLGLKRLAGRLQSVLMGVDPDGNIETASLNADHVLKVDVIRGAAVQVDPVLLTVSNTAVFNPGTDATEMYEVEFLVTNYTSTVTNVLVGVDLGGGTTMDRYYYNLYPIPGYENTGWQSLGRIAGDDDVVAAAAADSRLVMFFRVNQLA